VNWRRDCLTVQERFALRGMVPSPTPKRDHGDPQAFGSEARAKKSWCGRRDLNPHEPCGPTDFHATSAFAAAIWRSWSGLSLRHFRRCPSSLYTFPVWGLARDRHVTGFPEFEQFCIAGFPASTQVLLKSGAYAISPRPRGLHRFYPSCSAVGSSFFFFVFVFGRRMLIAAASRLFLRCEA